MIVDATITVPFILICAYSFFFGDVDGGRWFWWAFVGCAAFVMLPSVACVIGKFLPQGLAAALMCLYVLMLPVPFYMLLYKLHTGALNVLIYCVLILAVAKSVYSAVMVTKPHD